MKTYNKIIFILLSLIPMLTFMSCTDEDNMEHNKGEQALIFSANSTDIELDINAPESDVLKFSWTSGSNHGTNAAITYVLEIDKVGNNFATPLTEEFSMGINDVSYKTDSLNTILINELGVTPGTSVEIEARVTAKVQSETVQPVTTEPVKVKITTYIPISKKLYLMGTATPNDAISMNSIAGAAGGFTWQGRLKAGKFKFITTLDKTVPSYNKGADDTKLYYRASLDDSYDEQFEITRGGIYRITLNIINLAIHIEALESPEYEYLWFVGAATGWNFKEMWVDELNPFVYHYNAELIQDASNDGSFKIATIQDFEVTTPYFRPKVDGQGVGKNLDVEKLTEEEAGSDIKWNLPTGIYKIALNIKTMKIDIVKFTPYAGMYMVGDAAPSGWSMENATPMSAVKGNRYKFTWSGSLNAGELKFSCDKKSGWNGDWFLATVAGKIPSGNEEQMLFSAGSSTPDNKWKIETAGNYTIELDQLLQTVKITKE